MPVQHSVVLLNSRLAARGSRFAVRDSGSSAFNLPESVVRDPGSEDHQRTIRQAFDSHELGLAQGSWELDADGRDVQ